MPCEWQLIKQQMYLLTVLLMMHDIKHSLALLVPSAQSLFSIFATPTPTYSAPCKNLKASSKQK